MAEGFTKAFKACLSVLGGAMLILSIADVPAKAAIWNGWLRYLSPHLHTLGFRWFLGCLGILIALAPWIAEWAKPRMKLLLTPSEGPSTQQMLTVRNLGKKDTFSAFCEII